MFGGEYRGGERLVMARRDGPSNAGDLKWMGDYDAERKYIAFNSGPFSQWHQTNFRDPSLPRPYDGHTFSSCEQYMMLNKALMFDDLKVADQIIKQSNCRIIKGLGRQVHGFSDEKWDGVKVAIVIRGNYLKFSQNERSKKFLLATKPAFLVEGSRWDRVWGVGLDVSDKSISDPRRWRGENLLGKCLTYVRQAIEEEMMGQ